MRNVTPKPAPVVSVPGRRAAFIARVAGGRRRILAAGRAIAAWWGKLQPADRVMYRASGLLAIGCGVVWPPLAFIVPGALYALAFFGFTFQRRAGS